MDKVDQVNEILWDLSSNSLLTIIDHDNIDSEVLKDRKHVTKLGFYLFLANIRYVVFGKYSKLYY